MALDAKTRHRRLEARRARRRYRKELRGPVEERKRRVVKAAIIEAGAVAFTRFREAINKQARQHVKADREARKARNELKPVRLGSPLTARRLELVELSPEQAAREERKRAWLPVDEKRAEGRLKKMLDRRRKRNRWGRPVPARKTLSGF